MQIYYRVWSDAIKAAIKTDKDGIGGWKSVLLIIFSVSQGINILTIMLWIKVLFKIEMNVFINFNLFQGNMLNNFLSIFITLFLPFLILNYYLIFYKSKYKVIMEKYHGFKTKEGLIFMIYFIVSMAIFLLPVIVGKLVM